MLAAMCVLINVCCAAYVSDKLLANLLNRCNLDFHRRRLKRSQRPTDFNLPCLGRRRLRRDDQGVMRVMLADL